jgi:putative Holliday junction resolvase
MRYLGIDYGTAKTGLAISDETGKIAVPYGVLSNNKKITGKIAGLCLEKNIKKIIIGFSAEISKNKNSVSEQIKNFGKILGEKTGLEVVFETEVLTTKQAFSPAKAGLPRGKTASPRKLKKPPMMDASAAAIILQTYLDREN